MFTRHVFIATLLAATSFAAVAAAAPYYVTNLGFIGNGNYAKAAGMNNNGDVVGMAKAEGYSGYYGFLYTNGKMYRLGSWVTGTGSNTKYSEAFAINDNGQISGYSRYTDNSDVEAFRYEGWQVDESGNLVNGVMNHLGFLTIDGTTSTSSRGLGINNDGYVVGWTTISASRGILSTSPSVPMVEIGYLSEDKKGSCGNAISNNGLITGWSYAGTATSYTQQGFVTDSEGTLHELGTLGGTTGNQGKAVNNSGQVAGISQVSIEGTNYQRAFFYNNAEDGMVEIAPLGTGTINDALGINEAGDVVGNSYIAGGAGTRHAFLYSNGQTYDLNSCVNPSLGWTISFATDINDKGQICGYGTYAGNANTSFMLTPVLAGDANIDGYVELADLGTLLTFYNQSVSQDVNGWMKGDFNGDGMVDLADLGSLLTFYNQDIWGGGSGGLDAGAINLLAAHGFAVPEPSTLVLLLSGFLGIFFFARKNRLHFQWRGSKMKRLLFAVCLISLGATVAQADYIASISGTRISFDDLWDKITFTVDGVTNGGKVSTLEGTWMALSGQLCMTDTPGGGSTPPDWIYETNRSVRNTPPLSYCNFYTVNDSAGSVWARTNDGTDHSSKLTGSWYSSNNATWLGDGGTLAVMYVSKGAGVSFSGRMTAAVYNVGSSTNDYAFSVAPVIPEPSTLALLAAGLFGMLAYAWRKRK